MGVAVGPNIKMHLSYIECEVVGWIEVVYGGFYYQAIVNKVMNLRVS
jgi:hypothetical protein